ncbi:MAG: diaminopimelate epimerase [Deltaproteobacteria bacterium]|nr:diaminopimelate epimerase [Deltaproteobacteria bacterium]
MPSTNKINFYKYQALLNDYILIEGKVDLSDEQIILMCSRREGIGADGILMVDSDNSMEIINSDASIAMMCGNGLRCVIFHLLRKESISTGEHVDIPTRSGLRGGMVLEATEKNAKVRGVLGQIVVGKTTTVNGRDFIFVNTGNPHCVHFTTENEDPLELCLNLGPVMEKSVEGGINVSFARITPDGIELYVWERGAGFTMACGTGAVATAYAASSISLITTKAVDVIQKGGRARVSIDEVATLEGLAHFVFEGSYHLQ